MVQSVFTYGYGSAAIEDLEEWRLHYRAVIVDARMSPASRRPEWSGARLRAAFGEAYRHVRDFGNVNYKNGGPIELKDVEAGLEAIRDLMELGVSVIVLCGCWDHATCHRTPVAEAIGARYHVPVVHLARRMSRPVASASEEPAVDQMNLFDVAATPDSVAGGDD